jgi:hypothetical protein
VRGTRLAGAVAATALGLGAAAPAEAAIVKWTGKTNQGRGAFAWVRDGRIVLVKTKYRARCRNKRVVWNGQQFWRDVPEDPIEQGNGQFSDGGTLEERYKRGKVRFEGLLSGTMGPDLIEGGQIMRIRMFNRQGRQINVCKRAINFKLRPPS